VGHEFACRQDFYLAAFLLLPADFTRIASELKNPVHAAPQGVNRSRSAAIITAYSFFSP